MGAFALFKTEDNGFREFVCLCVSVLPVDNLQVCVLFAVRKLSPSEFPCKVAEGGQTLLLRKWVFSTQQVGLPAFVTHPQPRTVHMHPISLTPPQQEGNLFGDPRAVDLLFDQATADLEAGKLQVESSLKETLESARSNPVKVRRTRLWHSLIL